MLRRSDTDGGLSGVQRSHLVAKGGELPLEAILRLFDANLRIRLRNSYLQHVQNVAHAAILHLSARMCGTNATCTMLTMHLRMQTGLF